MASFKNWKWKCRKISSSYKFESGSNIFLPPISQSVAFIRYCPHVDMCFTLFNWILVKKNCEQNSKFEYICYSLRGIIIFHSNLMRNKLQTKRKRVKSFYTRRGEEWMGIKSMRMNEIESPHHTKKMCGKTESCDDDFLSLLWHFSMLLNTNKSFYGWMCGFDDWLRD